MAIEQWWFFSVPHLRILWHGTSVYNGHLRGPVTLTPIAARLAVLSLPVVRLRSSNTQSSACAANALTHCATAAAPIEGCAILHFEDTCITFTPKFFVPSWNLFKSYEDFQILSIRFCYFIIFSPWKRLRSFICKKLNPFYPKMPWAKFCGNSKFCCFSYLSLKGSLCFIWTILHPLPPKMLCAEFGWNWPGGSREEDFESLSMFRFYLPLKGRNPLFEQIWFLFTQWWFVSSSVKIGLVVLEEKTKSEF